MRLVLVCLLVVLLLDSSLGKPKSQKGKKKGRHVKFIFSVFSLRILNRIMVISHGLLIDLLFIAAPRLGK